jgi:hypothetical protein
VRTPQSRAEQHRINCTVWLELVCAILTHRTGNRIRFEGLASAHIRGDAVVMTVRYQGHWGSVRARARARLGLVDSLAGSRRVSTRKSLPFFRLFHTFFHERR